MMDGKNYPLVNRLIWIKRANEVFRPLEERFMELLKNRVRPKPYAS